MSVPWNPHGYQKRSVKFLIENACAGLFLDPGLGKSSITLAAIKLLKSQNLLERVLLIAPLRPCYLVWPAEQQKWTEFRDLRIVILHGKDKEERLQEDADVYLINPEGLPWLLEKSRFKQLGADTLVIDESSRFKSVSSKRFKLIKDYLPKFARRWILTGTPAPNGLLDLFGQIYLMDLGASLGRFITRYRSRFFYPSGFGGYDWKLQDGAAEEIQEAINPLVLRLKDEDYLTLPQIVTNVIKFELPAEARKIYDDLEEEFIAEIGDAEVVTAATAAAASMKCRQVANGALYRTPDDGVVLLKSERWELIHNEKINALVDLIDELNGQPLLIAYDFQHDLERLLAVLGKDTPYIGSGVSMARTLEIEKQWNAGTLPWLLGHPASMGHGLNLQGSSCHVAWFAPTWDLELYDQFNRRVRRQGNKHSHVFVHHFVAKDTVEERMLITTGKKSRTQNELLDALKNNQKSSRMGLSATDSKRMFLSLNREIPRQKQEEKQKMETATETVKVGVSPKGVVKKTAAAKPAGTKAVAAKAPAKGAAPKTAEPKADGRGRSSKYLGKKIKVVQKDHGAREGSKRAMIFDAIFAAKTSDDVLGLELTFKGSKFAISGNDLKFAEDEGLISLT